MLRGGRLAEEVILGSAFEESGGEGSGIHKAANLATVMEVQLGMGEALDISGQAPLSSRAPSTLV